MASELKTMESDFIKEFLKLGSLTQKDAAIASHVYLELREVKKYWDVDHHFNQDLKHVYCTARKTKSSPISVFIPVPISEGISFNDMSKYMRVGHPDNFSVNLAIVDSDFTTVYYEISEGISDPTPEVHQQSIGDQREKLDGELRKHRRTLEEAALCGLSVTIDKK